MIGALKKKLTEQISAAQTLFYRHGYFLKDFIVKPVGEDRFVNVDEIIRHIQKFRAFDILGITEKDLGRNPMEKLKGLAKLRLAMDREDVRIPIHIWGGLDPLLTPLYFFAGAEIFDGLSWLRYAYLEGAAMYRDSYSILLGGIESPLDHARAQTISHNLEVLRALDTSFRDFVIQKATNFEMFKNRSEVMEKAYRALVTQVPAIQGGQ